VHALLHDQEARHRPGPVRDAAARRRPRRRHHLRVAARRGHHLPRVAAAGRGASGAGGGEGGGRRMLKSRPPRTAAVLVVDDEPIIRETLAEYLTQEGFEVAACGDAEGALRRAAEHRFDVALCDVQLPGMDGLRLLERLRQINPETSVLVVTAYATV